MSRKPYLWILISAFIAIPSAKASETFHAMCGQENERCTVQGTGEAIYFPGVTITPESIIGWTMSDTTEKHKECTLFGCYEVNYAKRENFDFAIKYLDTNGVRQIMQFKFLNNRPAKRMANFLALFSDLQSGEISGTVRSQMRITAHQSSSAIPEGTPLDTKAANPSIPIPSHLKATHTPDLADFQNAPKERKSWLQALKENPELAIWAAQNPEDAAKLKAAKYSSNSMPGKALPDYSKDCKIPLKDFGCSWSRYLEANPNIKSWAEANPNFAQKEKIRLGAVD